MCICLVVVYVIKIPFFLTVLLTHYWVDEDGYNFGLFKYCVDNTGTCQDVSSKLQTIEDHILVTRGTLISACIIDYICLMFCMTFCDHDLGKWLWKSKFHIKMNVTAAFLLFLLEAFAVVTFAVGAAQLSLVPQLGWSFYLAVFTTVFTLLFLLAIIFAIVYCNKCCCMDTSSVGGYGLSFTNPPQNVSVDAGQAVSVTATVQDANNVYWCKGEDHVIQLSSSFTEEFIKEYSKYYAILTLNYARPQDAGEYTCVAEKYEGSRKEIRESFFIYVHHVKPVFQTKPRNVQVYQGDTINLEAIIKNAETVSWYHKGRLLSTSRNKITITFLGGRASLRIDKIAKKDEGDYICLAKSGTDLKKAKTESVYCHVRVIDAEPPSFHNVPKSLKVKRGTSLEMDIQVCGFPLPKKVFWFKDGNELHGSRRTIMQYVDGTTKLLIHETILDDSGSYECYTENAHGNNKCKIPVKVTKEKQEQMSTQCTICMDRPLSHALRCGHTFCLECIERIPNQCPICMAPYREYTRVYI